MISFTSKLPKTRDFFFIVGTMALLFLCAGMQPILTPDTGSYLEGHFFREPGYPFVVQVALALAGTTYAQVLVILQQLAGVVSSYFLCAFLRRRFELPYWLFALCMVVCLVPYLSVHTGKIGNTIQSEGLTYPLFLIAFRFLFASLADLDTKAFAAYIYVLTLLLLTRMQFMIFLPASLFCIGYFAFAASQKKQAAGLLLLLLSSFVISNVIIKANNYVSYGIFASPPTTYQQALVAPLYLAKKSDAALFDNQQQRKLFLQVFEKIQKRKAHTNFYSPATSRRVFHFNSCYNIISWQILYPLALEDYTHRHPGASTFTAAIALDTMFKKMTIKLIRANFKQWFLLLVQNIKNGVQSLPLLALLFLIVCIAFFRRPQGFPTIAFVILLVHITNLFGISLVEPTLNRYTFYTNVSMQLLIILCVAKALGCGRVHHGTVKGHV